MLITNEGFAVIETDTHLGKWVIESKRLDFDQNVLPFLLSYINKGDVVIDAGANIGCYAYAFLQDAEQVLCFEPYFNSYECLVYNLGNNPKAKLFNIALGNKKGTCTVIKDNDNVGMTHVKEGGKIDVISIDSLKLQKCDFIKIDVEGSELDVLIGARRTIKKFKPKLYIEINEATFARAGYTPKDIFYFLDKNGYTYKNIYPFQKMEGQQYDIICI